MENNTQLSKQSKEFLENLTVYLVSKGKETNEIEEIVSELEDHLIQAEGQGKPIEHIIGSSPKDYMRSIANEMLVDHRSAIKNIIGIMVASYSFIILPNLMRGEFSFSILEIMGHLVIAGAFIVAVLAAFRNIIPARLSDKMKYLVFAIISLVTIAAYVALYYVDSMTQTPVITLDSTVSLLIGSIMVLNLILLSIWSKTAVLLVTLLLITLPEYLLNLSPLPYELKQILTLIIMIGGFALYAWFVLKR
ncbi:HAAS domain-containing protein [Facklamia sp. P13055]|uniref:HAAS domain-containing protein n=1 Tax=unclassified Facklamia TaxID=2622293 RepID=UPI003D16A94A